MRTRLTPALLLLLACTLTSSGAAPTTQSTAPSPTTRPAPPQSPPIQFPNTPHPDFGPNVLIADPATPHLQDTLNTLFTQQESAQFGPGRYAVLFKPGKYDLDVEVGFYTHIAGLGHSPDDVVITGAVRSKAKWLHNNATCNFWRSVENLAVIPNLDNNANIWAVSQGTSLRHTHIRGDILLSDGGWSSGGFLADCKIDGGINSGSQQQWFSRNDEWAGWYGGSWNMVFVGCTNPPKGEWPAKPYTVIPETPVIREKPYLTINKDGRYAVALPPLRTGEVKGTGWNTPAKYIPLSYFYLAHAGLDTAETINAALDRGMDLLLTPGVYHLSAPIHVTRPDTIVLGLGFPTLIPDKGTAALELADVSGLKIAGLLLEAGPKQSPTLLQVGPPDSKLSHADNPTFLYDLFTRSGGANPGTCKTFVTINSRNVVGDNLWLWRADHGNGVGWDKNKTAHGLVVNGDDVTLYGLFVEHCQDYQTLWNANGGRCYFYQSEMPYDPPTQQAWMNGKTQGYASYKVADTVTTHEAHGLGVYAFFNVAPVVADTAIEAPISLPGVTLKHLVTIRLPGKPGSGINHIINDQGAPVITEMKSIR